MKIANAAGFWGDDEDAAARLASKVPDLDYITLDYLAELSLSIMASQREKDPSLGYARDFINVAKSLIPFWEKGQRFTVVTNAGGLNPRGLKNELEALGIRTSISDGDNVLDLLKEDPSNALYKNLDTGEPLKTILPRLATANAYLGSSRIVEALKNSPQVVITGRVADPSLTAACAIHHFNWKNDEWDKIAQATIAGHLIECGAQVSGGISSLWDDMTHPEMIGFPIVEMEGSGIFEIYSPDGHVSLETVKEQLLYEIGDPAAYISPDCVVSILTLSLEKTKKGVRVSNASGKAPTPYYKVSASYKAGYRSEGTLLFSGANSKERALKSAQVILNKMNPKPQDSLVETYGETGETLMRLACFDPNREVIESFTKRFAPLVTAGPPGTSGYATGRSAVRAVYGYWPCLIERRLLDDKA